MRAASFAAGAAWLLSAVQDVAAWGPRGSPNGPPGHYGGPCEHGADFQPDFILRITEANIPVACQNRTSVLVNGTSPGPPIRLQPGRRSWIRVYNDMEHANTTMHWHGLSQRMAPFSDGTPTASQWPIPAKHFFDYEVYPTKNESGTYFYHSHVGFQAISAAGPLIIEDAADYQPYEDQYDEERIIFITDYYNQTDEKVEFGLKNTTFKWPGEVNAVLINGVGVATGEKAGEGDCKLPVIDVDPGKTYRMRFIGGTAISMVQFAIEGHDNWTIIEADGSYTKPYTIPEPLNFMQLSTGQRFDVLFKTKTEAELNGKTDYLIQYETKDRPAVYHGYGVLRYSGGKPTITTTPIKPAMTLSNHTYDWVEYALEPLQPNNFPKAEEVTRRLIIDNRQVGAMAEIIWQANGLNWTEVYSSPYPGEEPYLTHIYKNGPSAMPNYTAALENGGWDPYSLTFPAKLGEVIEIIWVNTGSLVKNNGGQDYHPFHAHGAHYFDIGSGNGTYDPIENEKKLVNYNPVLRDTTNLYRYTGKTTGGNKLGWRGWRLRVTDPGVWMIHCHILAHMLMGMQSVWIMGDYEEVTRIPLFDAQSYLMFGGSAFGNETFSPMVNHYFEDADES
ncbi:Laccase-like multicopper oxidase 1 [Pseudocercospora fuligena]|uniref:Laccase-like multicopper oxidase 1 n=1 Tax=Pseudocercospora fuligena TaxID=685502 RepID=A0A8H6RTX1_9PEZI|nr:Laccase-like multicopper oxidase 1 [Pseudocercospora fuligena]